jgi:hypothetical protein
MDWFFKKAPMKYFLSHTPYSIGFILGAEDQE